jgi:WD40 repeat protein
MERDGHSPSSTTTRHSAFSEEARKTAKQRSHVETEASAEEQSPGSAVEQDPSAKRSKPKEKRDKWFSNIETPNHYLSDWQMLWRIGSRHPVLAATFGGVAIVVLACGILGLLGISYATNRLSQYDAQLEKARWNRKQAENHAADQLNKAISQSALARREMERKEKVVERLREAERKLQQMESQYTQISRRQQQLHHRTQRMLAEELAREAQTLQQNQPEQSLLLALQAIEGYRALQTPVPDWVKDMLRETLAKLSPGKSFGHDLESICSLSVSNDGNLLLTGCEDGGVHLWNLGQLGIEQESIALGEHESAVRNVAFDPETRWAISAGEAGILKIWDLSTRKPEETEITLSEAGEPIHELMTSPDGHWLVTTGGKSQEEYAAHLWDLRTISRENANPTLLRGHKNSITCLAISPDSHWLITGSEDTTARLYDLTSEYPAAEQVVLKGHDLRVTDIAISPNSLWVVTGSRDNTVRLWDISNPEHTTRNACILSGHEGWVNAVAISPDGRWVASGSYDRTARLWDVSGGAPQENCIVFHGHRGPVRQTLFTPSGDRLITRSSDHTVRLWNMKAEVPGQRYFVLRHGEVPITSLLISHDNRWLLTAYGKEKSRDSLTGVRLWPLLFEDQLGHAKHLATEQFGPELHQQAQQQAGLLKAKVLR